VGRLIGGRGGGWRGGGDGLDGALHGLSVWGQEREGGAGHGDLSEGEVFLGEGDGGGAGVCGLAGGLLEDGLDLGGDGVCHAEFGHELLERREVLDLAVRSDGRRQLGGKAWRGVEGALDHLGGSVDGGEELVERGCCALEA
jgi:hypothetical protein